MILGVIFVVIGTLIYNFKKKCKLIVLNLNLTVLIFKMDKILILMILEISINQILVALQMLQDLMKYKKQKIFWFYNNSYKRRDKKRYKELAKIYHPDINNGDDVKMKELNHYRDVLMKTVE